ncbi:MAG: glycosyltransferase N-terminal domain-containing protein [Bacteroidota bacterium]
MRILYNFLIHGYGLVLRLPFILNPKAKKWVQGRKKWPERLAAGVDPRHSWVWFHCASLGEFEQGRPLMEVIKKEYPNLRILVTFFSPSGYEIRHNHPLPDHVAYLPLDTPRQVRNFLEIVRPVAAFFIKYELWLNYLSELYKRQVPTLLVSARVRENSSFFKSALAPAYKKAFRQFRAIFTQDQLSADLIKQFANPPMVAVSGDTRYDRVWATAKQFSEIPQVAQFKQGRTCLMAGSTWPKGEALVFEAYETLLQKHDVCMVVAPHEIHQNRIEKWMQKFPAESIRWSDIDQLNSQHKILWIDNIGMLSRLYYYADIAYVGGGWGTGLHNILEAAVFGAPVFFGPEHQKFPEASEMIREGAAFSIDSSVVFQEKLTELLNSPPLLASYNQQNRLFVEQRKGATEIILSWIKQEGLICP